MVGFLSLIPVSGNTWQGFVAYPSSSDRHDSPSGAPASSQLRDPLEFVSDHQAVTLLPFVAAQISITDGVELLLTFYLSVNFLFHKSVRVFNVILILSCCQQDSVPTAAFRHASDSFG